MTVITDSNVVIAALIKNGIVRSTIFKKPRFWITPESSFDEIWEHRDVWNRNHLPDNELKSILDEFVEDYVILISKNVYNDKIDDANLLVDDKDDAPIVALCLSVENKGIWTFNTKHFTGASTHGITLLTTKEILELLSD